MNALCTLFGLFCPCTELNAVWLSRDVQTREQLRQEITEVIADNKCEAITPEKLRKVLLDMERVR